jgi:hypothetical protein
VSAQLNRQAGTSSGVAVPGTVAFLHTDASVVVFLQWPIDTSGFVSGTVKQDYLTGSAGNETVEDSTGTFAGQDNQGGITFTFTDSWGTVYGTESTNSVTLNIPQRGGGLQATTFQAATPDDYNSALAALQSSADQANQQAQQQAQQAAQAQAQSTAAQALNNDLAALQSDGGKVAAAITAIPAAETAMRTASATADGKLAAEKAYAGPQADCYQLSSMAYDTNSAVYDLNSTVYDLTSKTTALDSALRALGIDIGQAQKDEQAAQSIGADMPTGTDGQIAAATKAVPGGQATEQQAQTSGNNATQHGQDVSSTASSITTNCNNGG